MVFLTIEQAIRKHLQLTNAKQMSSGGAENLTERVLCNEDVQFFWCMVNYDIAGEIEQELLKLIVELWITIRGHSFAKSYMELYKQQTKKVLQRSKGLRKSIFTSNPV